MTEGLALIRFSMKIGGRAVQPGGFADAFKSSAAAMLAQQVGAKLDGLVCDEHGTPPAIEPKAEGSGYSVKSCCEALDARVRERFQMDARVQDKENAAATATSTGEADLKNRTPRAFISHTSSDKARFVRPLCDLLVARGIEPWLDERELLPGDNLVDKIFNEGISASDVFIIVLSANSIDRPWLKEELSVGVVQKIAGVVKAIIPIVLDDVTPPPVLSATVWETVSDLTALEKHADRIAASIFGRMPAPIAPAPAYAGIPVHKLAGLEADDERIFVIACEQILSNNFAYPIVDLGQVQRAAQAIGMSEDQIYECVHVLEQHGYFRELRHYLGENQPQHARIGSFAFERYLEVYRPKEYRDEKKRVIGAIANRNMAHSRQIAGELNIHEYVVEHIFGLLESAGHIKTVAHSEGLTLRELPSLARKLRELEN